MDILKRIGGAILGAVEGVLVVFIITAIMFAVNDSSGSLKENISVVWCIISGIVGAIIGFCYPFASVAIFFGLLFLLKNLSTRGDRKEY